ncbi:MAG: CDP-2,3-bis-(O-geranylgeranyl)-sn-glycerol synthase [Candidatus Micrarchaeota archaeon]|nr:CDP-2,3-bis-(O-geranylgeranyl)-sn-glycerol synthase [Candidatus Micrarchaeota archaeon]
MNLDINFIYLTFIYPIIYIFPSYAANGAPILFGGGRPLDLGRKIWGKRIFGDNKTIRGTASALLAGVGVGLIEYPFLNYMIAIAVMMALGAIAGDLVGSFVKRRLDYKSGRSFPVMDQYGFFVFALVFSFWLGHMPDLYGMAFLVVLTGATHVLTNVGAHRLRLKKVPW